MKKLRPLEKIYEIFSQDDVACKYYPKSKELSKPCLLVDLTLPNGNEKILKITADMQDLSLFPLLAKKKRTYLLIDYELTLSFSVQARCHADTALGILFINRQIPFGNFQLEAIDDRIYLRHSQMLCEESLDKEIITGTIGSLMLYSDLFEVPLKDLASGKIAYKDLMEQVIEQAKKTGAISDRV